MDIKIDELPDLTELIDNSNKEYEKCVVSGFTVNLEPGVFDKYPELRFEIERALREVQNNPHILLNIS